MKIKIIYLILLTAIFNFASFSQTVQGYVYGLDAEKQKIPLPGANIFWAGTTSGTAANQEGYFELNRIDSDIHIDIVASFVGYRNDTLCPDHIQGPLEIVLTENAMLKEVEIAERTPGAHISRFDPVVTQNITLGELKKAACCNLSESFETNASVDVNYSDAITGAKQIKLLGLAGKYSQLQTENIPNFQGLASSYGLTYVPGSWMESIQVSKGTSSVKNGYESVTGQINVEYKKPENKEKLFVNLYANHAGRLEGNINSSIRVSPKWNTAVFGHISNQSTKVDHNGDKFLDDPLFTQINLFNRWNYRSEKMEGMFGVKFLNEDRKGGQVDYYAAKEPVSDSLYGTEIKTNRLEAFSKTGFFLNRPESSIGWINSYIYHDMNSFFGLNDYKGKQHHYYTNLMFQTYISNTAHTLTTGVSYVFDAFDETLNDSTFARTEHVPGAFVEYSWTIPEKLTILAGLRGDYDNIQGFFFTPRLHVRYGISEHIVVRASAGRGSRNSSVIAENLSLLTTSRRFLITEKLRMEQAWNYGINLTRYIDILGKEMTVNAEFYRTDFTNQVIIDKEQDIHHIYVYNLDGKSFANAFQVEVKYELIRQMDVTAAFRYNDVKMTIGDELQSEPLVNKYKGLLSVSYATNLRKWQFDVTGQLNGYSRIPSTELLPVEYRRPDYSPVYTILNAQVTKFYKKWEIYLGGENLLNYTQHHPIIAADDPFGPYFDASNIWGPVSGVKIYAGVRFLLKHDKL
ncbi:MAG TPA: TonB-dependent receptor [Bacteroidales bacterium]|nr:TonB-dependent receptor [Bacteroidales bacterium]